MNCRKEWKVSSKIKVREQFMRREIFKETMISNEVEIPQP